jgi:hypothetical protein
MGPHKHAQRILAHNEYGTILGQHKTTQNKTNQNNITKQKTKQQIKQYKRKHNNTNQHNTKLKTMGYADIHYTCGGHAMATLRGVNVRPKIRFLALTRAPSKEIDKQSSKPLVAQRPAVQYVKAFRTKVDSE